MHIEYKKRRFGRKIYFGILLTIVSASIIVLFPNISTHISEKFGIGRGADFILYCSVIVLGIWNFKLYLKQVRHRNDLTRLVRQIALSEYERNNDNEIE